MASFTISNTPFPDGVTVSAYDAVGFSSGFPAANPPGTPVEQVVSSDFSVTFSELTTGKTYFIAGQVGSVLRYFTFIAGADLAQSGSAEHLTRLASLGEVSGNIKTDLGEADVFSMELKGNATLKRPTGWPSSGFAEVFYLIELNGHTLTIEGVEGAPETFSGSDVVELPLLSVDGGTTIMAISAAEAIKTLEEADATEKARALVAEGAEKTRAEAKEAELKQGILDKLILPNAVKTFKGTGSSSSETRKVIVEPRRGMDRASCSSAVALTSKRPIGVAIPVPKGMTLKGVAFLVNTTETKPAARTHLWVEIANAAHEQLAVSADYTSSTNTPLETGELHGLLFSAAFTAPEDMLIYAALNWAATEGELKLNGREGAGFLKLAPVLAFLGEAGREAPATRNAVATATEKPVWLGLIE
jgi:hypothetical protein